MFPLVGNRALYQSRKAFQVYMLQAWQHRHIVKRWIQLEHFKQAKKETTMKQLFLFAGLLLLTACDIPLIPGI